MASKLQYAGSGTLNDSSGMPQMSAAFAGWKGKLEIISVKESYVDGDPVESTLKETYNGVIQPLSPRKIDLKPEGQRAWTWYQVHIETKDFIAGTNDKIKINGTEYKIMAKWNYKRNNFVELHVIEGFHD